MSEERQKEQVLAIHPLSRGFAYTFFEGPLAPVDWGVKDVRDGGEKNARCFELMRKLIDSHQPDSLVLEVLPQCRTDRVHRLQRLIRAYALSQVVDVHQYERKDIRLCFKSAGATTRYEIAQVIASQIHALEIRLPKARKLWTSEDARMGLFDAASLVMTHYCHRGFH